MILESGVLGFLSSTTSSWFENLNPQKKRNRSSSSFKQTNKTKLKLETCSAGVVTCDQTVNGKANPEYYS